MISQAPAVEQLSGISPASIPGEVLSAREPVVLKGLVADWPVVSAARDGDASLLDYLRSTCRDRDILAFRSPAEQGGRYFYNEDLSGFNFERVSAKLGRMLDELEAGLGTTPDHFLYLGSTNIDEYFPGFRADNDLDLHGITALASIWLGNRSRIAAHFDSPDNVACVVAGRRRFTLFPPEQLANLYVGPIDLTPAGQAVSLVDFHAPDYDAYPRFREAEAAARVADLEPGDAVFVPSMWWHHVEGFEPINVLVNYWWGSGEGVSGNPLNALIHALMSIRGLPESQREAWRGLFDHYVFAGDDDNIAHIPENRRGVLGRMDAATLRQLRSMLRNQLG